MGSRGLEQSPTGTGGGDRSVDHAAPRVPEPTATCRRNAPRRSDARSCHSGGRQVAASPSHVQPGGPYSMNGRKAPTPSRWLRRFCTTAAITPGARSRALTAASNPLSGGTLIARTSATAKPTTMVDQTGTCRCHGCSQSQPRAGCETCGSQCRRNSRNCTTSNTAATPTSSAKASACTASVGQQKSASSAGRWGEQGARHGPRSDGGCRSDAVLHFGSHDVKGARPGSPRRGERNA